MPVCTFGSITDYSLKPWNAQPSRLHGQLTADSSIAAARCCFSFLRAKKRNELKGYLAPADTQQHAEGFGFVLVWSAAND